MRQIATANVDALDAPGSWRSWRSWHKLAWRTCDVLLDSGHLGACSLVSVSFRYQSNLTTYKVGRPMRACKVPLLPRRS